MADRIDTADTMLPAQPGEPRASSDVPRPQLAGRYELLGLIGKGGMGTVYRARDVELGELVALKMLRPDWGERADARERFRQEVRLARRVTHRNVARTFDIGDHDGARFLTMEYVDGASLASKIADDGALVAAEAMRVAQAICAGLAAAHQAGVIHRDLKPENVLIAKDGRVVVTDFGIALAAGEGEHALVGTPAYMAPEQLDPHGSVDHLVDVYALGAVIYEMLVGERAWQSATRADSSPDPRRVRPGLSPALAAIVTRCMAVDRRERYASVDEVARALADASPSLAPTATPAPAPMPRPAHASKTVGVLPIENRGDAADNYLAEGLTDDLIDTLSMTRGLLVRPRGVVAKFRGTDRSPAEIGRELSVQVIVQGSIRRVQSALQLWLRLIGVDDGFQLWAKRFEVPLQELFIVTERVAAAVAEALTAEQPHVRATAPADSAAIELYFRGKQEFWRMWGSSAIGAVELLEQALALAPSDPRIVAATAIARVRMLFFGEGDRDANIERLRELTAKAVAVAPELGDAWAALAGFSLNTGDLAGAGRAVRNGLVHAPASAMLQDMAGRLLAEANKLDDARSRFALALELDPTQLSARVELSRVYSLCGEWQRADEVAGVARDGEDPAPYDVHRARIAMWRRAPIVTRTEPRPGTYAQLYRSVAESGQLTPAQREWLATRPHAVAGRVRILLFQRSAEIYAYLGELEPALDCIEHSVAAGLLDLAWLERCPLLAPLHRDPRWQAARAIVAQRAATIVSALS